MTFVDTLSDAKHTMLQIYILPAQSKQFSDPKPSEDKHRRQGTRRLWQSRQ